MESILFLGTGPAESIHRKGETRMNSSVLVSYNDKKILIDCTPEFLEQVEKWKVENIDLVLLTHAHKDAVGGLSELDKWLKKRIQIYAPQGVLSHKRVDKEWKNLEKVAISPYKSKEFEGISIIPFKVVHYEYHPTLGSKFPAYGYKIGGLVYAEDMESLPEQSEKYFEEADIIIADAAMWFDKSIRGHMNTEQALELAKKFNPETFVLMQAGRTYPIQEEAEKVISSYWDKIKEGSKTKVILSYDGLEIKGQSLLELAHQAFGSPGGKSRIVKKLLKIIPEHKVYIEPFAGGASLFWNKEPAEVSVLNDKDPEIYNAYKVIKEITPERIEELKNNFDWGDTKELFFKLKDEYKPKNEMELFYKFIYTLKTSYGLARKTYGYKNVSASQFHSYLENLPKLQEKLSSCYLYNKDYAEAIKKHDSEDAFIYLDPPYPEEWGFITDAFTEEDYQKLYELLKGIKGKFLLSTNILPWIKDLFSEFHINKVLVPRTFQKKDKDEYEYLISNYDIKELAETGSGEVAGAPFEAKGLHPVKVVKLPKEKKEEKEPFKIKIKELKEFEEYTQYFEDFNIIKDFICLVGSTVDSDKKPNDTDLLIRLAQPTDFIKRAIETRINKMMPKEFANKLHFIWGDPEGAHDDFIPLYDLNLKRVEPKVIKMSEASSAIFSPYIPQKPKSSAYYEIDKALDKLKFEEEDKHDNS